MMKRMLLMAALIAVAACGRADKDSDMALADSLSRDLELAPVDTTAQLADVPTETPAAQPAAAPKRKAVTPTPTAAPPPAPTRSAATIPAGAVVNATAIDTLTSRTHKPGYVFVARTSNDLKDERGRIVVPAGAEISFTVKAIAPSENKGDTAGVLVLEPTQLMVDGRAYTVRGSVDYVEKYLKGRGVQAGDVAKVGAGTAIGAVAGRIIGGKKGTVIGGAVGAAAGTARALETYDRDVVVPPGAAITVTLSSDVVLN
ncbi:MAG TPA: hypothetical protein VK845_09385 [Gemmatimonadales bacterium]|nr:hypothetical protein [Gemmatimonadales bacterium]